MIDVIVRDALSDDLTLLWEFLAFAGHEPNAKAAQSVPLIAAYLEGWKRPGDFGCLAELDGTVIGAAWARQFEPENIPAIYAGPDIPEIAIGVRPEMRAQGIGTRLLRRLEEAARDQGCQGLCLTVRDTSPAFRLYERMGYERVAASDIRNRTGGYSFGMLLKFTNKP